MLQAKILEEAGSASALVDQHYLPAVKSHGWAAEGCIITAVDSAATLAFHLAARLMQLYPAHPPAWDPTLMQPAASPQASVPPTVEALVLVQSSRLQALEQMAMQPWYKSKEVVWSAHPDLDMRAFSAQGLQESRAGNPSSQMVRRYCHSTRTV